MTPGADSGLFLRLFQRTLLGVLCLLLGTMAAADGIRVAAAADLNYAFRDIAARFEKETGHFG
jgi:ABC-type molybdate transport system substrate-binding protein